jgi:N-acetylated-alpha-linked acidic dipeptidase
MERLSAKPHHLGSAADKENAEFIAGLFRSWGYDTTIETFYPLFPTPKLRRVEMIQPALYVAKLEEPAIPEDKTSGLRQDQLPVYNAFSIDGDVTAPLVYVNYGLPADYEVLAERGVGVKGKIVIARYGNSWRGIKPKVAAEQGAVGCLIYSDPRDDGYFQGDSYPKGGFRPAYGAQRGSVMDATVYPGDPLTPGVGATKDAPRLPREKAETINKIPVLPISYADATPPLEALGGPVAPEPFRGALPLTYHLGPGPAVVHLAVQFDWRLTPAYDVVARLPGGGLSDEGVIRGNHEDGWVFGASDPLSGLVPMMEEARGVAALAKAGWKPQRYSRNACSRSPVPTRAPRSRTAPPTPPPAPAARSPCTRDVLALILRRAHGLRNPAPQVFVQARLAQVRMMRQRQRFQPHVPALQCTFIRSF